MDILNFIPKGREKAPISRNELCLLTGWEDRAVRNAIHKAKEAAPIVNVGSGYYVATDPNDPNLKQYVYQEISRGREVFKGIIACRMLMNEDTNQERLF